MYTLNFQLKWESQYAKEENECSETVYKHETNQPIMVSHQVINLIYNKNSLPSQV